VTFIADGHPDRSQSAPNPPSQGESNFGDSSGQFFSIYSKTAEDEDKKMVDRWQKDADGILIFVSYCVGNHSLVYKPKYHRLVYFLPLLLHSLL
jgi:hypothetical protein